MRISIQMTFRLVSIAYEEFDSEEDAVSYLHSNNASYVKVNVK
jgi:hypothetical protein